MYLNPNNPHHGDDCICDSCCKYWHRFGQRLAEALEAQRATEQAIDNSGSHGDPAFDEEPDQREDDEIVDPLETSNPGCEWDRNPNP